MYLIYNKENKKQFRIVADYEAIPISDEWEADVVGGSGPDKGKKVASKSKGHPLKKEKKNK